MSTIVEKFFRSPSFKFMVIGTLSLLLLIPTFMIRELISERELRNQEASREISESWSLAQTITGPFISIPTEEQKTEGRNPVIIRNTWHTLPEALEIKGNVVPLEKKRGIFTTVVYNSTITLSGFFSLEDEELLNIFKTEINTEKATLGIGISDLRGIGNNSTIRVNGDTYELEPGLYNRDMAEKGVQIPLSTAFLKDKKKLEFQVTLELKGSTGLDLMPVGKRTDAMLTSSWPDPSFNGKFLPDEKNISGEGFSASWGVNYLNRDYPQSWYNQDFSVIGSEFGVDFLVPVDHYQKSERSVKYAFMFIALSFLVFFLTEIIIKKRIHPIQYLLVGFALIIFYTLLISLAEQVGFNFAYLISTSAVTLLIGIYMKSSTSSSRVGFISGSLLLALYGFLFTTLQLQELSLLMGSIGLFLILAVIMMISRKINWYKEEDGQ